MTERADPARDLARALCSDYPEDFDALSREMQAYWLRLARRGLAWLDTRDIALQQDPPEREAA